MKEESLRKLIAEINDGFFSTDAGGEITLSNQVLAEILGYDKGEELTGRNFAEFLQPEKRAEIVETFTRFVAGEKGSGELEIPVVRRDRERRIIGLRAGPIVENGRITGTRGVIRDITERKRMEVEEKCRARIADIFLTVPDEEMYGDVLQVILQAMDSKFGVFGYVDEGGGLVVPSMTREIWNQCQMPDKDILFPRETWGDSSWPRAIRERRTICLNEPSTNTPAGHIPIARHISLPILYRGEAIGLFQVANKETDYADEDVRLLKRIADHIAPILEARLYRDRQEKRRVMAENALAERADELARSNAELEQFAYVASHDLQEPLRVVTSYLQLLERRCGDQLGEEGGRFIGRTVEGAGRMKILIDDLLTYSRVTTRGKEPEPSSCAEALEDALDNLKVAIKERDARVTRDDLPEVQADGTQLTQLFQNLVGNAVKFGGEEAPRIHVGVERGDGEWAFSVRDNGIGIEPEYAGRIFEVFQRLHTRREYEGTGIGLAVCKKIVERHGGRIRVESKPGEGSTFHFTIADGKSGQNDGAATAAPAEDRPGSGPDAPERRDGNERE